MGEYRAEEVARAAGVSVALLRSYQSKGLLPPPRHQGRTAVYGDHHIERLRQIAELKERGHSLRSIAERLEAGTSRFRSHPSEHLRLEDVSERSGVPVEMLRSWEASGLIRPRQGPGGPEYTEDDVRAVGCVLFLVGNGIPFERFVEAAQPQLEAGEEVARRAVALFVDRTVPRLGAARGGRASDEEIDAAASEMAAAIGELAAYVVERQVLAAARGLRRGGSRRRAGSGRAAASGR
jgi:DNA-binding transcriptional MerR regulator